MRSKFFKVSIGFIVDRRPHTLGKIPFRAALRSGERTYFGGYHPIGAWHLSPRPLLSSKSPPLSFVLKESLTLASNRNGINPVTQKLTRQIGNFDAAFRLVELHGYGGGARNPNSAIPIRVAFLYLLLIISQGNWPISD
jgi:hypothetical protein